MDPLTNELTEIHEYVRYALQMYLVWFTFFTTLLLAAMGWSLKASISASGRMRRPLPFLLMYSLFMPQLGLSVFATDALVADVQAASQRVVAIVDALNEAATSLPLEAQSPVPTAIEASLRLMRLTLWSNIVFWTVVAVVVTIAWRKKWVVASNAV